MTNFYAPKKKEATTIPQFSSTLIYKNTNHIGTKPKPLIKVQRKLLTCYIPLIFYLYIAFKSSPSSLIMLYTKDILYIVVVVPR